ncbi:MAG: hypothetical protein ABL871_07660 [Terricaulis sp.]
MNTTITTKLASLALAAALLLPGALAALNQAAQIVAYEPYGDDHSSKDAEMLPSASFAF